MSFLPHLRASLSRSAFPSLARRTLTSTSPVRSATGYGDPEEEKPSSETPSAAKSGSNAPKGQGGAVRSAGSKERDAGGDEAKEMKETKKVGEEPKKTEEGGAGPIGG